MVACACLCLWHLYIFTYCLEFDYNIRTWPTHQCHCIAFGRFLILRRYAHTHTHTRPFHPLDSKYVTQLHVCACAEYHVRFEMMDADVCDDLTSKAFTLFHLFFVILWYSSAFWRSLRSTTFRKHSLTTKREAKNSTTQIAPIKGNNFGCADTSFCLMCIFSCSCSSCTSFLIYAEQFSLASRSEKLIICSLLKLEWYRGEGAKQNQKHFHNLKMMTDKCKSNSIILYTLKLTRNFMRATTIWFRFKWKCERGWNFQSNLSMLCSISRAKWAQSTSLSILTSADER